MLQLILICFVALGATAYAQARCSDLDLLTEMSAFSAGSKAVQVRDPRGQRFATINFSSSLRQETVVTAATGEQWLKITPLNLDRSHFEVRDCTGKVAGYIKKSVNPIGDRPVGIYEVLNERKQTIASIEFFPPGSDTLAIFDIFNRLQAQVSRPTPTSAKADWRIQSSKNSPFNDALAFAMFVLAIENLSDL